MRDNQIVMVCPLVFAWSNVKCDIFNDTLDFIDPLYYVRVRFFIQYDINTPNFNLNPLSHLSNINLCYSDWQAPLRAGRPAWIFCSCIHAAPILTSVPAQAASCLVLPTKWEWGPRAHLLWSLPPLLSHIPPARWRPVRECWDQRDGAW